MTVGSVLSDQTPIEFLAAFLLGSIGSQLFVVGIITARWQTDAMEELSRLRDEPKVFGKSHWYWDLTLWWSPLHVVRFHRLLEERNRRANNGQVDSAGNR